MAHPERHGQQAHTLTILIEKAGLQGYLTLEDLEQAYPNVNQDAEKLTVLVTSLRRRGVDILDMAEETALITDETIAPEFDYESWANPVDNFEVGDSTGLYLREMARVPLLTHDEEIVITRAVEEGREAAKTLLKSTF